MGTVQNVVYFDPEKGSKHEKENLSYQIFRDIDYSAYSETTSFYRSDFRGSRFVNVTFYNNNFDIADFISNTFLNTEFQNVKFGAAEFKNCYFNKSQFIENDYTGIAVNGCTYVKSSFQKETFRMAMKNCKFIGCTFIECNFDQCSTDTISFESCVFIKCDLSTMHAENYKISKCTFRYTFLGACFLGTYLIKDTDFNLLAFKYRGEIVNTIESDYFEHFAADLYIQQRYFEYFNMLVLFNTDQKQLADVLNRIIKLIPEEDNQNVRKYNLENIFELISFYAGSDKLSFSTVLALLCVLDKAELTKFNSSEKLMFSNLFFALKNTICAFDLPIDYIKEINPQIVCETEFRFQLDDPKLAMEKLEILFDTTNKTYLNSIFSPPYYLVLEERQGSIVLLVASSLLLILMSLKAMRTVISDLCEMRLEVAKASKAINLIEQSSTIQGFTQTVECIDKVSPKKEDYENQALKIHGILGKTSC